MYDFASSGYTAVVVKVVFNALTLLLLLQNLLVLALVSAIAAWTDTHAAKRRLLMVATAACGIPTAALVLTDRGAPSMSVVPVVMRTDHVGGIRRCGPHHV